MKKLYTIILLAVLAAGCASVGTTTSTSTTSKTTPPAAVATGNWDYVITGTPEGDFAGIMVITSANQGYTATMNTSAGNLDFNRFSFDAATGKATGEFSYSGTGVSFDATVVGDTMNGNVNAGGMEFPFKATRKK